MKQRHDWKQKLYDQYIRIDKTKGILTIGLLIANLSLTFWGLLGWDYNAYLGVPMIMLLLGILGIIFANVWVDGFQFYKNERRAKVSLNPTEVYQMNPFQIMIWSAIYRPQMWALYHILYEHSQDKLADDMLVFIRQLEKWIELRYIPKEDFPEDLKHHYLAEEGEAL